MILKILKANSFLFIEKHTDTDIVLFVVWLIVGELGEREVMLNRLWSPMAANDNTLTSKYCGIN